uniref:GSVIVT01026467001 n=1 Tax=Arundo donax TaxID=35708 RepID=A0A0A9FNQ2_ARUDO
MSRASDEGLILIEGTGPTYATETTFQESLLSAGAGITLVDSVCWFPKKCYMFS